VRFALAVLGAGALQIFPYLHLDQWIGPGAALAIAYIEFAAFGAGFFAGRRPWFAGALSVVAGALLYTLVAAVTGPGADLGGLLLFFLRIPIAVFPFIIFGALAGWLGGATRSRILRTAP
jgi:hypothetical protein